MMRVLLPGAPTVGKKTLMPTDKKLGCRCVKVQRLSFCYSRCPIFFGGFVIDASVLDLKRRKRRRQSTSVDRRRMANDHRLHAAARVGRRNDCIYRSGQSFKLLKYVSERMRLHRIRQHTGVRVKHRERF